MLENLDALHLKCKRTELSHCACSSCNIYIIGVWYRQNHRARNQTRTHARLRELTAALTGRARLRRNKLHSLMCDRVRPECAGCSRVHMHHSVHKNNETLALYAYYFVYTTYSNTQQRPQHHQREYYYTTRTNAGARAPSGL